MLLAVAHDADVNVWDVRKTTAPLLVIHGGGKLHSIDWSFENEAKLVTSSEAAINIWSALQSLTLQVRHRAA
jgi:predicted DCC family thiol-disulfide oxidoreductase YuxK